MENFFRYDYSGPPFVLFGPSHIAALVAVALSCIALVALLRSPLRLRLRDPLRIGVALFCLLNQVAWNLWNAWAGIWSVTYLLPLHICTLSMMLAWVMLFWRSYLLFEVLYFWAFSAALVAHFFPEIGVFGFPHFVFIIFFTSHSAILLAVLVLFVGYDYRPTWRSIAVAVVATNLLMMLAGLANWLTGGNYMYLAHPPAGGSPIDYLGAWPWYILSLELIGLALFFLLYLPFVWVRGKS